MAVLGELTEAEKAKIAKLRGEQGEYDVSEEYIILTEFGLYFGFEGVRAIVNNEIKSIEMVLEMIKAARKLKGIK